MEDRDGFIWMDGEWLDWREAKVHVLTHTLHYGMGAFEGVRAYETDHGPAIFKLKEHTERLFNSTRILGMKIPFDAETLNQAQREVITKNNLKSAYIRPMCFYGSEGMGLRADNLKVHTMIAAWEWGAYYGDAKFKGAKLDIAKWKRPSPETIPCFAKAAGLYMICTMSKHAAEVKGCSDAMMLDYRGYVAEATGANLFFVKDGEVHTPKPDCFLNGITRQTVVGMLQERGVTVIERHIMPEELEGFEQCWLTGTAAEVTPVGQIGDYTFEVGALARDIAESYEKLVRA